MQCEYTVQFERGIQRVSGFLFFFTFNFSLWYTLRPTDGLGQIQKQLPVNLFVKCVHFLFWLIITSYCSSKSVDGHAKQQVCVPLL